jgi:hypothetical protein
MSRSIKFAKAGGPEVLDFVEVQIPAPEGHEPHGNRRRRLCSDGSTLHRALSLARGPERDHAEGLNLSPMSRAAHIRQLLALFAADSGWGYFAAKHK